MRCPQLLILDKFRCVSAGMPEKRRREVRREFCDGGSYRGCPHYRRHGEEQLRRLHASLMEH